MRILLTTFGSRGDVQPVLALAIALRSLGADARVCAPADEEFVELFATAGVPLLPAFTSVRAWLAETLPKRATISLPQLAAHVMASQYDAISAAVRAFDPQGCDAMVATGLFSSMAAARSVADKWEMRYVHAAYCPMYLPSPHNRPLEYPNHPHPPGVTDNEVLWKRDVEVMNAVFGGGLASLRKLIGLPMIDNIREHVFTSCPMLAADAVLAPFVPGGSMRIEVEQTGAWLVRDERALPDDLLGFLARGSAPVYVGLGSLPAPKDFARAAIDAIRAHGRRVLMSRGWAELALIDESEDCFIIGEVNQQALFPRVAAVIHHGGAGTTTAAALAGRPQIVLPQFGDQPYWASRVTALGIGSTQKTSTAESLSEALDYALRSETAARAQDVSKQIRTDGAMRAAKFLLDA